MQVKCISLNLVDCDVVTHSQNTNCCVSLYLRDASCEVFTFVKFSTGFFFLNRNEPGLIWYMWLHKLANNSEVNERCVCVKIFRCRNYFCLNQAMCSCMMHHFVLVKLAIFQSRYILCVQNFKSPCSVNTLNSFQDILQYCTLQMSLHHSLIFSHRP